MGCSVRRHGDMPLISERDGIIIEVNDAFFELSGFSSEDLMNKSFDYVWYKLLRIAMKPSLLAEQEEGVLFTKSLNARMVHMGKSEDPVSRSTGYYFEEIPGSRIEEHNLFLERLIADNKTGIGVITAHNHIFIKANQTYMNFFPKPFNTREMFYGKYLKEVIPDFEGSYAQEVLTEAVLNNKSVQFTEQPPFMRSKEGRYWDYSLTPLSYNGEVKYIVAMIEDVTERVMSRDHIRKQNMKLNAIMENMTDAVYTLDREGRHTLANKAALEMIGRDINKKVFERYFPGKYFDLEDREIPFEELPFKRALRGERVIEEKMKIKTPSGTKYTGYSEMPIFDEKGEVESVVVCARDITQDIKMQKTIEKQREELKAVIENIEDAIFIYDKDYNHYMINKAARDYFPEGSYNKYGDGYEAAKYYDIEGKQLIREEMPISRIRRGEVVKNHKIKMVQGDNVRYISVSGRPVYDEDKSIRLTILHSHDITEEVKREEIIKEQQNLILQREIEKGQELKKAMELKDEFLYLITHEFRTPMAVVNSALQVINLTCKDEISDNMRRYLRIIKQNTNRQLRLVNNLLDITRMSSGNIKMNISRFDAVHVVKHIVESIKLYSQQKDVNIYFNTSLAEKYIFSDEEKLERIMLNLLSNALKFTPWRKSIYVNLAVKKHKGENSLYIGVQDEGYGIPREKQKIIFDRFGQVDSSLSRRAEGTGLGLHLVKLLVNALEGEIKLKSEVNKGSTFTVIIPLLSGAAFDEAAIGSEERQEPVDCSNRVIESAAIEFSDIYY